MLDSDGARALITALGGEQASRNAFLAAEFSMAGVITAAYAITVLIHLRGEERALRVEPLLATALDRRRLLAGYLLLAVAAPVLLLTALGLTAGLAYGIRTGSDPAPRRSGWSARHWPSCPRSGCSPGS